MQPLIYSVFSGTDATMQGRAEQERYNCANPRTIRRDKPVAKMPRVAKSRLINYIAGVYTETEKRVYVGRGTSVYYEKLKVRVLI